MAEYRIFAAVFILHIVVDGGQGTCSWTVCDESNNAVTLDLSSVYNHSFDATGLGHVFSWSICTNDKSCNGDDAMVIQTSDNSSCQVIASFNETASPLYLTHNQGIWKFQYNGDTNPNCNGQSTSWNPTFICDPESEFVMGSVTKDTDSCGFKVGIQTKYACTDTVTSCDISAEIENSSSIFGSCYEYGCGSYSSSHHCACNTACKSNGDCCSDYDSVCARGHFEECPSAPITPQDRRQNKESLRLVSWNVEWLFLNFSHSMGSFYCPGTGCSWTNTPDALEHAQLIAKHLDGLDGDIIVVSEVCDCWTLRKFIGMMSVNGPDYRPYLLKGADTATGQNVGIITKIDPINDLFRSTEYIEYPVADSACPDLSSTGTTSCSKHFGARFQIEGLPRMLTIFGVHFLAIPSDSYRCLRREGQATVIANMVQQEVANGNMVVIAGDFNDYAESVCDISCHRPISAVESILRSAGDLVNAAERILLSEQRYSSWWNCDNDCVMKEECLSMIDQVLVSRNGLFEAVDSVRIDHGFESGCDSKYSDHWPVVVDFDINKVAAGMLTTANDDDADDHEFDRTSLEPDDEEIQKGDNEIGVKSLWTLISICIATVIVMAVLCYIVGFKMGKRRRGIVCDSPSDVNAGDVQLIQR